VSTVDAFLVTNLHLFNSRDCYILPLIECTNDTDLSRKVALLSLKMKLIFKKKGLY